MSIVQKILFVISGVALLILCCLIIYSNNGLMDLQELTRKKEGMVRENTLVEQQNAGLFRKIDRLKNDDKYIETIARDELGMIGSDEVIYILRSGKKGGQ